MRTILIIGTGAGHPGFLTLQATEAMGRADADDEDGAHALSLSDRRGAR